MSVHTHLLRPILACSALGLAGCGLAVDGLEADGGGVPIGDGGLADVTSGGHDAAFDGMTGPDGTAADGAAGDGPVINPVDATPQEGCVATGSESCTNGLDDDCNGLIDCADPACSSAGYACVPAAPGGWTFVAFDAAGRPGCPAGLTTIAVDVDPTNLTSPATCGCSCGATAQPSCVTGNIAAKFGPDNTCASLALNFSANGGACVTMMYTAEAFVEATPPPATGGTCSPTPTVDRPATGATQGEACQGQAAFGGGCSNGQVCGQAPSGFEACVHHGGAVTCPAGSAYSHPHAVGTLDDTRGCGTCACAGSPTATCASATWTFFQDATCSGGNGNSVQVQANGVCNAVPASGGAMKGAASSQYSASPTAVACAQPAAPAPTGGVQLQNPDTVCCE